MLSGILVSLFLPGVLGLIMFGMGLSLVPNDFYRLLSYPRAAAIGFIGQIIFLPCVAWFFCHLFSLRPEYAVGLMTLSACAGGAISNLIVYMARGDIALSVTLTALSSVTTVFTIPLIVAFSMQTFMPVEQAEKLDVLGMNARLFMISLLPVLIGMLIRHLFSEWAINAEQKISRLTAIIFVVIVIGIIYQERANFFLMITELGPVSMAMNVTTMAVGFIVARLLQVGFRQASSISIEIGVQNSATGIYIGATLLQSAQIASVSAAYSIVMMLNAALFIMWVRHKST